MIARLLLLAFLLVAFDARAQFTYLDDPSLTTGSDTDRVMIAATTVSTSQQSMVFTSRGAQAGIFTMVVTLCTACNLTLKVETQDPDGTWYSFLTASAAVVATGTTRYGMGAYQNSTSGTDLTQFVFTRLPPKFRIEVVMTGTSATYTVQGMVW